MSIASHHAEWLSLLEVSGPFLSLPVLQRVFPQGLDRDDPALAQDLRLAFEEWDDNQSGNRLDPLIHRAWFRFVLRQVLEFPDDVILEGQAIPQSLNAALAEQHETLRPDLVIADVPEEDLLGTAAAEKKPVLLVNFYPREQNLEKPVPGRYWKASPATRVMALLLGTGCRLGVISNGDRWMLVRAVTGDTTSFVSWYSELWLEERLTLRAFRSLLSARRFFNVQPENTLERMLQESAANQKEVTDQLGIQVRQAVEVLIRALDRADRDRGRHLLSGIREAQLYEAALTVMMRLVFLLSAEERGLLLLGDPVYDQHYAVSTLQAQLRETADRLGEEVLERRRDAWSRLLATFRAVHSGARHDRLQIPAYGGELFDPDRFPFLEGRLPDTRWQETPAVPLPIDNRTVLHLLEALQYIEEKAAGGKERRRLSFRALDIEQIGHVYESLLDHSAFRASEVVLGLRGKEGEEPEIPLARLEEWQAAGAAALVARVKEETGRSENAVRRALAEPVEHEIESKLRAACENDGALLARVRPYAGIIRNDTLERPVVILAGSLYVTAGLDRRSTGTHYTPRSLTEPIVQHALEPLVYGGPVEGAPRGEWKMKPARELLKLKICDMACGSGAFLVQACRYLSDLLLTAWEEAEKAHPGVPGVTPEGDESLGLPGEELIPKDPDERRIFAMRAIAQRCLYGVDKNELAAEMAKLSLWLLTLAKGKPFTFLNHNIRHGDSLIGVSRRQLETFNLAYEGEAENYFLFLNDVLSRVADLRSSIAMIPLITVDDLKRKERLLKEAEKQTRGLAAACDILLAVSRQPGSADDREALRKQKGIEVAIHLQGGDVDAVCAEAETLSDGKARFHWFLAFPEVFIEREGFDAVIGNPPFIGGQKITGLLGTAYREHLVRYIAQGQRGSADYSAYFFLRAVSLLKGGGCFGLLATNTIAQGDTREVGLDQITRDGCTLTRAIPSRKWPGEANLEVAHVWARKGPWPGPFCLDEQLADGITPQLTPPGKTTGNPFRLAANADRSFQGSNILGLGFTMTPEEAKRLIISDPRNREVVLPFLNGEDLNSRADQSASRWVISFRDWPLCHGAKGSWVAADDRQRKEWRRSGVVPNDYPDRVAAEYPACLAIVEEKVKPERLTNTYSRAAREKWWLFERSRPELYTAIAGLNRVLIRSAVSAINSICLVPTQQVYSHATVVFASDSMALFALLQSFAHTEWLLKYASTLETRIRYTPSDCFETFPLPTDITDLGPVGQAYHDHRDRIASAREEGLTDVYKRSNDPTERSLDIDQLREFQIQLDRAVAAAYRWNDLDLDHGFHKTRQGVRFTISERARQTVLDRLLALNHQRHAQEEAAAELARQAKPARMRGRKPKPQGAPTLFE